MKKVCEEKNLDPLKYDFKRPGKCFVVYLVVLFQCLISFVANNTSIYFDLVRCCMTPYCDYECEFINEFTQVITRF